MDLIRGQKYSPLPNEGAEFEEHNQPKFQRGRLSFWSQVLCYSTLVVLIPYVLWMHNKLSNIDACGSPSDKLFGHIPRYPMRLDSDERFIKTDPGISSNETTIWDEMYPGTFVAIDNPALGNAAGGGMKMIDVAVEPDTWSSTAEGFGLAVMHQMHCVITLKTAIMICKRDPAECALQRWSHLHHCLEILRQSVMCQSDLTLEHLDWSPSGENQKTSGWGNVHLCRDYPTVLEAIRTKTVERSVNPHGWIRGRDNHV